MKLSLPLIALLVCAGLLLAFGAFHTGVTADEPGHLVSARLYWQHADHLRPQDMPPVIKIAAGWAPRLMTLPLPAGLGKPGEDRREWEVAIDMMQRLDPTKIQRVFFLSRLPLIVFPLLTIVLIWTWGRRLFPARVAWCLAAAFALEPTALAHGALFKNDLAATFAHLLFWFTVWRYWKQPLWRNALIVGAAAAFAILSKLSLLFVIPLFPLLLFLRLPRVRTLGWIAASLILCYGIAVAAYQFDVRPLTADEIATASATPYLPRTLIAAGYVCRILPIPTSVWTGIVTLFSNTSFEMPVYLLGRVWPQGNPFYFAAALAVKVPVSLWVLLAAGAVLAVRRVREWSDAFWMMPSFMYIGLASSVPLQLGVRLVLPALPFGLLLAGVAIEQFFRTRQGRAALLILAGLFLFEAGRIYPNGIAFFNLASGGPSRGFRYLADSNLDWGQGLGDLAAYTRRQHIPRIRLSYFGNDMMFRYFRGDEVAPIAPPWSESLVKSDRLIPEPGIWYAISPTLLPGQFFAPKYKDYYAAFRHLEPVARPGYSIFVYHIEAPPQPSGGSK